MSFKLLAVVDYPGLTTGFGKVGANLLKRWGASGFFKRIDIWAIGYSGYPGDPGKVGSEWYEQPPFVRYGQLRPGYWNNSQNMQDLVDIITRGDYTHVWVLQDHFNLVNYKFHQALRVATGRIHKEGPRKDVRTYFYCPVDGAVEPGWAAACHGFDEVVAYTEFGKRELERNLGVLNERGRRERSEPTAADAARTAGGAPVLPRDQYGPNVRVLPHGVDPAFRILCRGEERDQLRATVLGGFVKPGEILLLNVNANQRRKDVARTLEILAGLKRLAALTDRTLRSAGAAGEAPAGTAEAAVLPRGPRFRLVMHMSRFGPGSEQMDLEQVAEQLGLVKGEDWMHTGNLFKSGYGSLSDAELNELYNCADIYLTTTLGEGWGMGITEAAAAGCALAVPAHTACEEIVMALAERMADEQRWRLVLLPLEAGRVWLPTDNCRGRRRVDIEEALGRLRLLALCVQTSERVGLMDAAQRWLDWDRIAGEWLGLFREGVQRAGAVQAIQPTDADASRAAGGAPAGTAGAAVLPGVLPRVWKRAEHFYIELGGGLGDIFNGLYHRGRINLLRDLPEGATATVALLCHNPFAREIFEHHPKVVSGQVQVLDLGYWDPKVDGVQRAEQRLPLRGSDKDFEAPDRSETLRGGVAWFVGEHDKGVLRELWRRNVDYFVVAAGAGLNERTVPQEILNGVCARVMAHFPEAILVVVGRNYERGGDRVEPYPQFRTESRLHWGVMDLRDQLTVPATALLLQRAKGLINSHSALNILGWNQDRYHGPPLPQLVLYPESVQNRHFLWTTAEGKKAGRKKDEWSWGADNGRTVHGLFRDWCSLTEEFAGIYRPGKLAD